ncbi:MAG: response regulator [Candidatus Vogelbacteria bacterium]
MTKSKETTILIVEDEAAQRKPLADELRDEGFRVLTAQNGQEGLELALREHPDLILLDILMPVMDGLTMMKKMRETNLWGKQVPIILLTNLSANEEKMMQAITRDEPAFFLVKSDWTLQDVVSKIKERLAQNID